MFEVIVGRLSEPSIRAGQTRDAMSGAGTVHQEIEQRNREFVAALQRGDAAGVPEVDLQTQQVESSGDLAYEIGSATLAIQPEGSSPTTDTVKYVVVWKR